jgi:hypothetical protein
MKTIVLFLTISLFFSCKKSESLDPVCHFNFSEPVIKSGYTCSSGAETDTLVISKDIIEYVYYAPAESANPKIKKSRTPSENEWTDIRRYINMDDFVKLNYNSCNACAGGYDEWISVKKDSLQHKITFERGYVIDSIRRLQEKIFQLRTEFKKQ